MATRTSTPKRQPFQWVQLSRKQKQVFTWWHPSSPVHHLNGIIADGAIRTGKSLCMSTSFVLWAMTAFNGQVFGLCGKTIGSFRRNVLFWLKIVLPGIGCTVEDRRSENLVVIRRTVHGVPRENYFYLFGGKDESSQDLIQGITLAGVYLDEVVLMPESFVVQATGRCSVPGSKLWFNCNPGAPHHWFNDRWVKPHRDKGLLRLRFTLDDNLALEEAEKQRYLTMYEGVFYRRFILGEWAGADGLIYRAFADDPDAYTASIPDAPIQRVIIGVDFGGNKSASVFEAVGFADRFRTVIALDEEHRPAATESPDTLTAAFVAFVRRIKQQYPMCTDAYCDSAEQILIRGFRAAVARAGLAINIKNARKSPINDRIRMTCELLGSKRLFVSSRCAHLIGSLQEAIWDEDEHDDVRLDDGTYEVDPLDAFEYAIEPMAAYLPWTGGKRT